MSNRHNREQAAALLGGQIRRSLQGVETIRLADGDEFTYPPPPIDGTTDEVLPGDEGKPATARRYVELDHSGEQANRALWSLARIAQETHRIAQDGRFTQAGRDDALRETRLSSLVNVADAYRVLHEGEAAWVEREHALYAVPQLERSDAVGALDAREAREWVRNLRGKEREDMLAKIAGGKADAVTLALLRSPVPIGTLETLAMQAWRTSVERRNPDAFRQLAADLEQLNWAKLLTKRAAQKIAEKANLRDYALFEVAASSSLVMPHGPRVFFGDAEYNAHRTRWEAQRKRAA